MTKLFSSQPSIVQFLNECYQCILSDNVLAMMLVFYMENLNSSCVCCEINLIVTLVKYFVTFC